MFGMMLTGRGRDGGLMVAGAGPGDSPEAAKNYVFTFEALDRKYESLRGDVSKIWQAIIGRGQEEAESSWKALFKRSEGFPEPSQGPPEATRRG